MIVPTSIVLILVALFVDLYAIPRLLRALPEVTDWRLLRPCCYFLWGLAFLLATDAVALVLTWVANGLAGWSLLLVAPIAYLAWRVRPSVPLIRRIDGLKAMELAVEDWTATGGGR